MLRDGSDLSIFAMGLMMPIALRAADKLNAKGIKAAVVNFHTIKPFDVETALLMAEKTGIIVTAEEHSVIGGLASATAEALFGKTTAKFDSVGINDTFGRSGSPNALFEEYGLNEACIVEKCIRLCGNK